MSSFIVLCPHTSENMKLHAENALSIQSNVCFMECANCSIERRCYLVIIWSFLRINYLFSYRAVMKKLHEHWIRAKCVLFRIPWFLKHVKWRLLQFLRFFIKLFFKLRKKENMKYFFQLTSPPVHWLPSPPPGSF